MEVDVSDGIVLTAESSSCVAVIMAKLCIDRYEEIFISQKVSVNGIEYCPSDVVVVNFDSNDRHVFLQISNIAVHDKRVLLIGSLLDTLYFDNHYGAYVVNPCESSSATEAYFINELLDVYPLSVIQGFGNDKYFVPLRYWICRH